MQVLKHAANIRTCGHYRLIVNGGLSLELYPIPGIEDICSYVRKTAVHRVDMNYSSKQSITEERSKMFLNVNTHKDLFAYN